jgi:hypothetical protein
MVPSDEVADGRDRSRNEEADTVKINFGKIPDFGVKTADAESTVVSELA